MAHSSIRPKELTEGSASQQAINAAWMSKLEQANNKAALAMPSSQEAERISSLFQQINQKIEKEQRRRRRSPLLLLLVSFAIWGALVLFFSLMPEKTTEQKISSQNSHLEYIVEQVNDDIADGLFDRARNKAYSISFDESLSPERHGYWEKQKEELLNRIQEAQEASDVEHQKLLDEVGSKTSN